MKPTRDDVLQYLLQSGVPYTHALGIIPNIQAESGFDPSINEIAPIVPGSRGGFGLFQHTGPRRKALEAYAEQRGVPVSDWQAQIDFALTEPDTERYLSQQFADPADASRAFTTQWLRPANAEQRAEERLRYLDTRMGGDTANAGMPVPAVSPYTLPDKGAAMYEPPMRDPGMQPLMPMDDLAPLRAQLEAYHAEQENDPFRNPWIRMGMGILANPAGAGGSPLAGAAGGALGALQGLERDSTGQALRADMQLYQLEAARAERMRKRREEEAARQAREALSSKYPQYRTEIDAGLGVGDIMRMQGGDERPDVVTMNGVPTIWDRESQAYVPAPTMGLPEPAPAQIAPGDRVTWTNTVADNYRQESAPLAEPVRRWQDVSTYTPGKMDGAQQRALVVAFAKALDPTSAVMEGEADAVANTGRQYPWIDDLYRKAIDSAISPKRQIEVFNELRRLAAARSGELRDLHGRYVQQFGEIGIDPAPYIGPAPGEIEIPTPTGSGAALDAGRQRRLDEIRSKYGRNGR
ncbi:MAG: hypothetical protein K9L70_12395 [Thiohalocapsa sp.]|nr:hypothetical protein [Thiohalocapsa sp.]MCF7992238.1 hypothetical protein [Thiohalocapsa sp.]